MTQSNTNDWPMLPERASIKIRARLWGRNNSGEAPSWQRGLSGPLHQILPVFAVGVGIIVCERELTSLRALL